MNTTLDPKEVPAAIGAIRLPVQVILGRVTRTLGDVYGLYAGALIDLERSSADPVEVIVNGRVIAWGELVVSNGRYGVKIVSKAAEQEVA